MAARPHQPDDLVLLKPRHSAFFATPLDLVLSQMHARNVVLTGLAAEICVLKADVHRSSAGPKLA